jgi:hypothetical protein
MRALDAHIELIRRFDRPVSPPADPERPETMTMEALLYDAIPELRAAPTYHVTKRVMKEIEKPFDLEKHKARTKGEPDFPPPFMFTYLEEQTNISPTGKYDLTVRALLTCQFRVEDGSGGAFVAYLFKNGEDGQLEPFDILVLHPNVEQVATRPEVLEVFSWYMGLWLFSQEEIAGGFVITPDRFTRRRANRVNIQDNDVIVVTLRRTMRKEAEEAGVHNPVFWTHRWEVESHWHRYWCGSIKDGTRRLEKRLVPLYEKGPDDKPLIRKNRVKDVRR